MFFLLTHKHRGLTAGLIITLAAVSSNSYALSCKKNGSIRQDIVLAEQIKVSTANTVPGALLWRSPTFTSTFQCVDDRNHPGGENAYLSWDPKNNLKSIHNSIEIGVNYGSIDYKLVNSARQDIGPGTRCRKRGSTCLSPAQSLSLTVSYSIYKGHRSRTATGRQDNQHRGVLLVPGRWCGRT